LLPLPAALGWDETGHASVGVLAVELVSPSTREALAGFLDSMEPERIASACNWPDRVREAGMADWSRPLHYVNPDPNAEFYRRSRDCPDGECLPEAVRHYAAQVGDGTLSNNERKEAFAFLCHFVGDLHQPLHVGYAADRGGNDLTVFWNGQAIDLHHFWDREVIDQHVTGWEPMVALLRQRPNAAEPPWTPAQVDAWTNESLTFMRQSAYPEQVEIDPVFAERSWLITQQRLDAAATRLAKVLDAELDTEVDP
jgi:hypothetical protein